MDGFDPGGLLLNLAAAAWRYERMSTLLVDADPFARLTRAATDPARALRPRAGDEPTIEQVLDAAASFEAPLDFHPWRLSQRARSLVPSRGDIFGAHARALGAVVRSGGALSLGERLNNVFRPLGHGIQLTLVLAPDPASGAGALLCSLADRVIVLARDFRQMTQKLRGIDDVCRVMAPEGPDEVVPVLVGAGVLNRPLPEGEIERLDPISLAAWAAPEDTLPILRALT